VRAFRTLYCGALLLLSLNAWAEFSLEAPPPPEGLPEPQRTHAQDRYGQLQAQKTSIEQRVVQLHIECHHVDAGDTGLVKSCSQTNLSLREAINGYNHDLADYKCRLAAYAQTAIPAIKSAIAGDQEALRRLGFDKTVAGYAELQEVTEHAREDLQRELMEAAVTSAFSASAAALTSGVMKAGSLGTGQAEALYAKAQRLGITNPDALNAILALGKVKGKPEMARQASKVIGYLKQAGEEGWSAYKVSGSKSDADRLWDTAGFALVFVNEVAPEAAEAMAGRMPVLAVNVVSGGMSIQPGLSAAPAIATFIHDMRLAGYAQNALDSLDTGLQGQTSALRQLDERIKTLVAAEKFYRAGGPVCDHSPRS
jgi:hypothetical protein